jgi:hypothetical protein
MVWSRRFRTVVRKSVHRVTRRTNDAHGALNMAETGASSAGPLHFLTISELAAGYRSREFSPVEVTEAYLRRIRELNPVLNSYLTVNGEFALEAARRAERAFSRADGRGPLDGVPVGLKDLIESSSHCGGRIAATAPGKAGQLPRVGHRPVVWIAVRTTSAALRRAG